MTHRLGVSILLGLTPCSGDGGASTIVDGVAAAEAVAAPTPRDSRTLIEVAVPYVHRRAPPPLHRVTPFTCTPRRRSSHSTPSGRGSAGCPIPIRLSAMIRLQPPRRRTLYWALSRFARLVRGGHLSACHRRLAAGEAFIYDNQRVLHGRTGDHLRGVEQRPSPAVHGRPRSRRTARSRRLRAENVLGHRVPAVARWSLS